MKNNHNGEFEVKVEGELQTKVESQSQSSSNIQSPKSGGNAPSDLGAINKNTQLNSASNSISRSNLDRSSLSSGDARSNNGTNSSNSNKNQNVRSRQTNSGLNRAHQNKQNSKKQINANSKNTKTNLGPNNKLNPLLNQNRMKNFGKNKTAKVPNINSSASFFDKAKGLFNGKGIMPKLPGIGGFSNTIKKTGSSAMEKIIQKKAGLNFLTIFKALPIQVKIAIIGGGLGFFLLLIVIIVIIATRTSAADGNRDLKDEFIKGDYTEEELCEYLDDNHYLVDPEGVAVQCQDHPAYKFFINFKEVMNEYEDKYEINRFQVNVELLYETLAYYRADEEFYQEVTKDEIKNLIDAMLEEIEESCVVKTYDAKTKVCTQTKYVYTLYEFSLNKYISYLKYGTTSTHPNYGNDPDNKSESGTAVTRICGEGKNTDYVFGFGLVNTSSSPLSEGSNCPNNPVEASDYETLPVTKTTLEKLGTLGGVPYYETVYNGDERTDAADKGDTVVGSGNGADVAKYALQFVGNPYVYGGNSLTKGTDCSGFVKLVYEHFNINLSRTSKQQVNHGKSVTCNEISLKAGDLIFYDNPISHVAIYIGDGKIVHAKGAKWGITTDKYNYSSKGINACRRIVE